MQEEGSLRVRKGFTDYAQLRLRDHRPGIGDYQLPTAFGPGSDSQHKSILRRHRVVDHFRNPVGPGQYNLPDLALTARTTQFGPVLDRDENGNIIFPSPPEPKADDTDSKVPIRDLPKQFSLALMPDTPQYSLYGKLGDILVNPSTGPIGPGEYTIASDFSKKPWGIPKGAHFGIRCSPRRDNGVPGPGAYDLRGFTDELPSPKEYNPMPKKKAAVYYTPGPGAYEDPTTIEARICTQDMLRQTCTFGGRCDPFSRKCGPGPAAYNTANCNHLFERKRRHAPKFRKPSALPRKPKKKPRTGDFTNIEIPSMFDYDKRKGKSIFSRWVTKERPRCEVGPGDYDTSALLPPPRTTRFASNPFDPYASAQQATEEKPNLLGNPYNPSYKLVEKRSPSAVFNSNRPPIANTAMKVPGPGHYNPDYDRIYLPGKGTVFYKGNFNDRGVQISTCSPGPGANYNDDTEYSGSINGSRKNGKTFGIRYPARATYQVAPPRDETTNINCTYPDEHTWESPAQ